MRIPLPAVAAFVLALVWPAVAEAQLGRRYDGGSREGWGGSIYVSAGQKLLDEDDWDPVEEQLAGGIMIDLAPPSFPVHIAIDARYSFDTFDDSGLDVEGDTMEINLGVRKYFEFEDTGFAVFVGGGVCFGFASLDVSGLGIDSSESGSGVGFWANAGVVYSFEGGFTVGAEVGYSSVDVDFEDLDFEADAGGLRWGLMLGFRW